jgi:hypothetical protein
MSDVKVKLLKPLDGQPIGTETSYPAADVKRLEGLGAVKRLPQPNNKKAAAPKNKGTAGSSDGDGK